MARPYRGGSRGAVLTTLSQLVAGVAAVQFSESLGGRLYCGGASRNWLKLTPEFRCEDESNGGKSHQIGREKQARPMGPAA